MIALIEAKQAGLFKCRHILPNILSGLVVGAVALPLAMAFAIASGAKPEQGLYTALISAFIVSVFGGSRVQIAGPTGAFIVILAGITAKYGISGLQTATFLAGFILVAFGVMRLGGIISFISAPVITGFTTGIGVIIWISQWKDFFGLPAPAGEHFYQKLWSLLQAFPHLHLATTALALSSLFLILITPHIPGLKRIPGPLVALCVATLLESIFHFPGIATIGTAFGGIPHGLPSFRLQIPTLPEIYTLLGPAFTIALLGAIESLLSATVADSMAGTKHRPNQELVGQGLANIVSPLFGGFAATGAIARTATNIRNGGNSPLAGIVHSLFLALVLLFLTPLASSVPLCTLSAILFVVAYNMSEIHRFVEMAKRAPYADIAILLTTFTLTIFTDLVIAVNVGIVLSIIQFLRRMASSVEMTKVSASDMDIEGRMHLPEGVLVYTVNGPFFFGAVQNFEQAVELADTHSRYLIIRLNHAPFADMSGLQALEKVIKNFQSRSIQVILCEANARLKYKLERAGILSLIGSKHYFDTFTEALASCRKDTLQTIDGFVFDC